MKKIGVIAAFLSLVSISSGAQQVFYSPPITPTNVNPGYYNLDPSLLPHWRGCVDKVRAGTGRCTLAIDGDSTTVGAGSATSTNGLVGAFTKNYPSALATLLATYVATSNNSFFGDGNVVGAGGVTYNQYDSRVVLGANWAAAVAPTMAVAGFGGRYFQYTTGAANALTFTPTAAFDTIKIFYIRNTAFGTMTTDVDGGASLGTINAAGAAAVLTQTYTVAKGTHVIHLNAQNDAQLYVLGVIAYDSTISAIDQVLTGAYGTGVNNQTASAGLAWGSANALKALAPDLTIICLTINDSNNDIGTALYSTNLQTIITAAKVSGDVLLVVGAPSNTAIATNGTLDGYIGVLYSLAVTNGAPVVDLKKLWTSYAVKNAITPYFDTLHPKAEGYQDVAGAVFSALALSTGPGAGSGTGIPLLQASPITLGHPSYSGAIPVVSACGTSPSIQANSTDNSGRVTVGSTTATCTITFGTAFTSYNHCLVQSGTTLAAFAYTYSLSAIVVTATTLGGDLVDFRCDGL